MTTYIKTLDFGIVPIRKRFTDGNYYASIDLSYRESDIACFAEIRMDYRTNQLFAVLFDKDWNQIV